MNDLQHRWITALRSGEYQQARGRLRKGDAYCCLGVLCHLSEMGEWSTGGGIYDLHDDECAGTYLAPMLSDAVGMSSYDLSALACMNDSGSTFAEIADEIERMLGVQQ